MADFTEKNGYKWWVLFTVSLGSITVALDQSILVAILPQLTRVFKTDSSVISWVNLIYYVMSLSLMLTLAKVGDAKGRKRVYITGLAFYTAGMLGCALSQNVAQLLVARAIQGVGAATGFSLSMAIAVAVFPSEQRGRAIGILAGVNSAGLVVGPVAGGLLLDFLGWRGVFYGRAPLAFAAIAMAWLIVKEQRAEETTFRLDLSGATSLFSFLTSFLLFLSFGSKWGFRSPVVLVTAAFSLCSLLWFLIAENRTPEPILRLGLFRRRLFASATASGFFNGCGASMMTFLVPFYLVQGLGFSGSAVGLTMALVAAPLLILSPVTGRLSDRIGTTVPCTFGMVLVSGGLFLLSRPIAHPSYTAIAAGVALVGVGTALFLPPNNSAVVGSVPKEMLALASGVAIATRQVGVSGGVAVAGGLFGSYQLYHVARLTAGGMESSVAQRLGSVAGFGDALLIGAILSSAGIITSLIRGSGSRC
jgi:EmrB/QacA subfamily drug resistance transporter